MAVARDRPGQRQVLKIRGKIHTAALSGGRIVIKAWPVKRGPVKSALQKEAVARFSWAATASKYVIDNDRIAANTMSADTMYLPRDMLVSAMFGNLVKVKGKDGTIWVGARKLNIDLQLLLDQISNITGAMLVRGEDEWVAITPAALGAVLTDQGPGLIPRWLPPAGGGSGNGTILATYWDKTGTNPGLLHAARLQRFIPLQQMHISAIHWPVSLVAGTYTWEPFVATMDPANNLKVAAIQYGPAVSYTETVTENLSFRMPLFAPVTCNPGTTYGLGCVLTNHTTTTDARLMTAPGVITGIGFPAKQVGGAYADNLLPAVNTLFTTYAPWFLNGVEWNP